MEPITIRNPFPGAVAFGVHESPSTMEEAKRLVNLGFPRGSVVTAQWQSAGRGRFPERSWEAEKGQNLLMTLVLGPEDGRLPGFTLRMGLALCRALDLFALEGGTISKDVPKLKWPNDAYLGERKIAGILCEAKPEATFVGMGINVNQRVFPPGLTAKATSLALALDLDPSKSLDRNRLLELILDQAHLVLGEEGWREEAEAILWHRGQTARFLLGLPERGEVVEGRILGLSSSGALRLSPSKGGPVQDLVSGELLVAEDKARVDRGAPNHIR